MWGERLVEAVRQYRHWNGILVLANDENNGRVVVGEDGAESFEAHFDPVELERMETGLEFGRRAMEAAGAKRIAWTGPASTHVQGTCRMGSDPARSVGRRPRRVTRRQAPLRRRRLGVPEDALGQSLDDDHGPRRPARSAPRRGPKDLTREGVANVKAAVLNEYNRPLELEDRPQPEITRANQVLVKIEAAGVCSTDLHAIEGEMGPAGMDVPRVLGHENGGRVDAVGDLVSSVRSATRC